MLIGTSFGTSRADTLASRALEEASIVARMTGNGLAVYCRYNACCNEHRFDDLAEFVARDVVMTGTDRALDACAERLRAVHQVDVGRIAEVRGTADDLHLLRQLRERKSALLL